ncbi:hypothetical protein DFLDMN_004459 [Cupriavidus sp. H19C3]
MRHAGQRQQQRRVPHGTAPLMKNDRQDIARQGRQRQPQHGRGRFVQRLARTQRPHGGIARLRQHLEPAQRLGPGAGQPHQDRAKGLAAQHLLGGPQHVGAARGLGGTRRRAHPEHLARRQVAGQRHRVGQIRRIDEADAAARGRERAQGRHQQAQLARAILAQQQFGHGTRGPAATRQLGGKRVVTGRPYRLAPGMTELPGSPQARIALFEVRHGCALICRGCGHRCVGCRGRIGRPAGHGRQRGRRRRRRRQGRRG